MLTFFVGGILNLKFVLYVSLSFSFGKFMSNHPVLWSYRRCPYAMRARMAIYLSGKQVEQREIVFWEKPQPMLEASPKGTVPVLVLPSGEVIDESRDIINWAFADMDIALFSALTDQTLSQKVNKWIDRNDNDFKPWLDKYKYSDRFPEQPPEFYRQQGETFLIEIEKALAANSFLLANAMSLADIAVFPFIRQFVNVDKNWFEEAHYPKLKQWLAYMLESDAFKMVMKNRPVWEPVHQALWVHEPDLVTKDQFTAKALAQ